MKNKKLILIIASVMATSVAFSQDSVRTRNDKPGTPASLRTPDNSPQNGDPVIDNRKAPVGTISHSNVESNKVTHPGRQTYVNGSVTPGNDNTINNVPINSTNVQNGTNNIHKSTPTDSVIINGAYYKKPSNVTNPIRH